MARPPKHSDDFFVLALQQAALSCLPLLQPTPSSAPYPITHHSSSPAPQSPLPCQIPPLHNPSWTQFAHESFALPPHDHLDSLCGDQPPDHVLQPAPNDASVSDCPQIQWADLHSLDNLQSAAETECSWLDNLPPIENFDSTSEKLEFIYGMPAVQDFDTTADKLESFCSTSTSSLSSFSGAEECGPETETTETHRLAQPQSAVRDASCSSIPLIDEEQWVDEPIARSPCVSAPRKKRRISDPSEPTYLIVTKSDEEVLDDGFKWRKYGQKIVKNSIYPRSYYRCSYAGGCKALKQVQRSPVDHSLVWTTYKGRHAHQLPTFMRSH